VVFARKPDGTWRICYDYWGFNAITRPAVEPLPHIDALLDGTRGSLSGFFTKLDVASRYHELLVRASDQWKTKFWSQLGQFEWNVAPFCSQGASSLLMWVMNQALAVSLNFPSGSARICRSPDTPAAQTSLGASPRWSPWGVRPAGPGALYMDGCVYIDNCLVHSLTLAQHRCRGRA
jgi:hypothetical protein